MLPVLLVVYDPHLTRGKLKRRMKIQGMRRESFLNHINPFSDQDDSFLQGEGPDYCVNYERIDISLIFFKNILAAFFSLCFLFFQFSVIMIYLLMRERRR